MHSHQPERNHSIQIYLNFMKAWDETVSKLKDTNPSLVKSFRLFFDRLANPNQAYPLDKQEFISTLKNCYAFNVEMEEVHRIRKLLKNANGEWDEDIIQALLYGMQLNPLSKYQSVMDRIVEIFKNNSSDAFLVEEYKDLFESFNEAIPNQFVADELDKFKQDFYKKNIPSMRTALHNHEEFHTQILKSISHIDKQYVNQCFYKELKEYEVERQWDAVKQDPKHGLSDSYHFRFFCIGFGYSAQFKINVARKMRKLLKGATDIQFTQTELRALNNGALGKIMAKYKYLHVVPAEYLEQESKMHTNIFKQCLGL